MAINKVVFGSATLVDLTNTTATASDVASGKVFYTKDGTQTTGTKRSPSGTYYIYSNGVWYVPDYAYVEVNVSGVGGGGVSGAYFFEMTYDENLSIYVPNINETTDTSFSDVAVAQDANGNRLYGINLENGFCCAATYLDELDDFSQALAYEYFDYWYDDVNDTSGVRVVNVWYGYKNGSFTTEYTEEHYLPT